jgi:hypothetical protein
MQDLVCNIQSPVSIYLDKLMRRLQSMLNTLGHNSILLPSRPTVLVKETAVIMQNISHSISTTGHDSVSLSFRVLN